jgi:hypothetical protein
MISANDREETPVNPYASTLAAAPVASSTARQDGVSDSPMW